MSSAVDVAYIGEGPTDAAVARTLIRAVGGRPGQDFVTPRRGRGKDTLDQRLEGLNRLARIGQVVLVLRDLDNDEPCPGALVGRLIANQAQNLCLRIPVRSVETWLLADRKAFADAIGVAEGRINHDPETLLRPKAHIVDLARTSRKQVLRRELVPASGSGIREGPLLAAWLSRFAEHIWNPGRAARSGRSQSLSRALFRLEQIVAEQCVAT